jgi:hypothetical protein
MSETKIKKVKQEKVAIPDKLKPYFDLGYDELGVTGDQSHGTCPLCGKDKLYININTGQFDCKTCVKSGNVYSFIQLYLEDCRDSDDLNGEHWDELEEDRGIPLDKLQSSGITWDGSRWLIPAYNKSGTLIHLGFYTRGRQVIGISGLPVGMYGMEKLGDKSRKKEPIYCMEGFWDMLAMELIIASDGGNGICVGTPGAGTFKEPWAEQFEGRDFYACYDNDLAGRQGVKKAHVRTKAFVKSFSFIEWPDTFPEGYDIRDHFKFDGSYEGLQELFVGSGNKSEYGDSDDSEDETIVEFSPLSSGERPTFKDIMTVYERHLFMTDDLRNALKVIYAVIISNQLPGEPLWMHVVGSPGAGKTELLTSCSEVGNTILRSTLTPHALISGFRLSGGHDPSLLPKLFDKTFILKDYTEILGMNKNQKDEIHSTLRGAYDGTAEKAFGTGETKFYKGKFTMLTGVTHEIYGESNTSLGERFLLYNIQHVPGLDMADVIMAAISNSGGEVEMKKDLQAAAKLFLEWEIVKDDLPAVSTRIKKKLINLAQLVAMLRATVKKVGASEKISYRPSYEVGTRLAKQFYKLTQALGLLHYPAKIGDAEYRLVQKVAMDSCIGWNRDTLVTLAAAEGKTANEISAEADVPLSTIREHLNALCMLKVLRKELVSNPLGRGGDVAKYYMSPGVRKFWDGAGMQEEAAVAKISKPFTIRRKRN